VDAQTVKELGLAGISILSIVYLAINIIKIYSTMAERAIALMAKALDSNTEALSRLEKSNGELHDVFSDLRGFIAALKENKK
jgi:hypothetical protein